MCIRDRSHSMLMCLAGREAAAAGLEHGSFASVHQRLAQHQAHLTHEAEAATAAHHTTHQFEAAAHEHTRATHAAAEAAAHQHHALARVQADSDASMLQHRCALQDAHASAAAVAAGVLPVRALVAADETVYHARVQAGHHVQRHAEMAEHAELAAHEQHLSLIHNSEPTRPY
eukprot:TRINITY_DN17112_c0_g2_i2.p1 TRINITY_DN17112_c0_g2~~TRINITY_DN17112_c0_g2_i2.p1  ORF type:complete len:173 (-),score=54.48 TRINITY_DN17112_c0_g2_i2:115-633(-)